MGKWQTLLAKGDMDSFEQVREHSAELLKEMLDESGEVRGAKAELAVRLAISPAVLSNILAGKRKIPIVALKNLMARLQEKAKKTEPEKQAETPVPTPA